MVNHKDYDLIAVPPKKGTFRRELLLRMLSPKGITYHEFINEYPEKRIQFKSILNALMNEKGYDIRAIPLQDKSRTGARGRNQVYRCVGKYTANGYRSFVKKDII